MSIRVPGLPWDEEADLDLGGDVYLRWVNWYEQEQRWPDSIRPSGATIFHRANTETGWCAGAIHWWQPPSEQRHLWTLHSLDPLDLSPSILCSCGFHGYIKQGRWVPC